MLSGLFLSAALRFPMASDFGTPAIAAGQSGGVSFPRPNFSSVHDHTRNVNRAAQIFEEMFPHLTHCMPGAVALSAIPTFNFDIKDNC